MKLNEKVTEVFECDENEKKFNIIANDKMFKILSSKIYANKILAPIRELSTNAYDAHVECGKKEIPFEVHVPSSKEKYFSVRDFGKGLFPKEVEQLYTTYGYSSKSESNDYVGCLGLGSKSPFAYVNNFKVVSFNEGKKYSYICYMDNGVPKINAFDACDTKQPSGMLIEFNVLTEDIINFYHECLRFFEWFDVKPVFTGANMKFKENKVWRHDVEVSGSSRDGGILMGNIFYPITHEWDDFCLSKKIDYEKIRLVRNKLVLKAEIGDFDISVSRESLEITEKNVKKINELVESFLKAEEEDYKNCVASKTTNIEKFIASRSFLRERMFYLRIDSCLPKDLLFYKDYSVVYSDKQVLFKGYRKKGASVDVFEISDNNFDFDFVCANEYIVVFDEKCRGSDMFRQYVKNSQGSFIVLTGNKKLFEWCKEQGFIEKKKDDFLSFKVKREKHEKDKKIKIVNKNWNDTINTKDVSLCELQDEDQIFYCCIDKNHIVYRNDKIPNFFFDAMKNYLGKNIYGLSKSTLKYIENDDRFINIEDVYKGINFEDINTEKINAILVDNTYLFVDFFKNGFNFNEGLMKKDVVSEYKIFRTGCLGEKIKMINGLNKKEKLYFDLNRYKIVEISNFMKYIEKNFPLLIMFVNKNRYNSFTDKEILDLQDYVRLKEREIERNI